MRFSAIFCMVCWSITRAFHCPIQRWSMAPTKAVVPTSLHQDEMSKIMSSVLTGFMTLASVQAVNADSRSSNSLRSDEVQLDLTGDYLGLGLLLEEYDGVSRVVVSSVKDDAPTNCKNVVKPGFVLVSVGSVNVEKLPLTAVAATLKSASRPVRLVFRDTTAFYKQLNNLAFTGSVAETAINDHEVLRVERVVENSGSSTKPAACIRPAAVGDVVEISYNVRLSSVDSKVIDGVKELAAADSLSSDNSFYFVLGSLGSSMMSSGKSVSLAANNDQKAVQTSGYREVTNNKDTDEKNSISAKGTALPPGWDRYSMVGMCVGERRRITVPPSLAFGVQGLDAETLGLAPGPRKISIPPNTPLVIEVRLLSLNGIVG